MDSSSIESLVKYFARIHILLEYERRIARSSGSKRKTCREDVTSSVIFLDFGFRSTVDILVRFVARRSATICPCRCECMYLEAHHIASERSGKQYQNITPLSASTKIILPMSDNMSADMEVVWNRSFVIFASDLHLGRLRLTYAKRVVSHWHP